MQCLHSRACPIGAASTHVRPQSAVRRHLARAAFADRFSGEWEGALATFDASGKAEQLPEAVVPPQFKEWDVQVCDWKTRCSTSAVDERAMLRLVKLLPTAGCEPEEKASEDSWSCKVQDRKFGDGCCLDDGAYLCGTRLSEGAPAIFVAALPISEDRQVRICAHLSDEQDLQLARVDVHLERKFASYSTGRDRPEADVQIDNVSKQKLASSADLAQQWQAKPGAISLLLSSAQLEAPARVSQPPGDKVITLPVESWVSMSTNDDLINIQAGVMLDKQSMYVARMEYKDLQPCTAFLGVDSHT